MDYVTWCDDIAAMLADYAELNQRHVHLHSFAAEFCTARGLASRGPAWQAAVCDAAEICAAIGKTPHEQSHHFKLSELAALRNAYDRWMAAQIDLDDASLMLLGAVNRRSQRPESGYTTAADVHEKDIFDELAAGAEPVLIDHETADELLRDLDDRGLVHAWHYGDGSRYRVTYIGAARIDRARVADDRFIDALRSAGEGDALDFKRSYKFGGKEENAEFARDVTAMANAGGGAPRYLLLGIEDDGVFYRPANEGDAAAHRALLDAARDERMQQILASRTTHTPSVRAVARGEHRDGPYVLIEIDRDIAHLPYRVYADQEERRSPDAHAGGDIWVRKGKIKQLATAAEIEALEAQAALHLRIRSGR